MEFSGGLSSPMKYHFWHQDIFGKTNRLLLSDSGSKQILVSHASRHRHVWRSKNQNQKEKPKAQREAKNRIKLCDKRSKKRIATKSKYWLVCLLCFWRVFSCFVHLSFFQGLQPGCFRTLNHGVSWDIFGGQRPRI